MFSLTISAIPSAHSSAGHPQRLSHRRDCLRGRVEVELELAAQRRVDPAQHEVGVGHRRPGAAPPVARRSGVGARALRSHPQGAAVVDPGDRTAARADAADVEHRRDHRPLPFDLDLVGDQPDAVLEQRRLEAGAADVGDDQAARVEQRAQVTARGDPAGRTRGDQLLRALSGGVGAHHPAVALDDEQRRGGAGVGQLALEVGHVVADHRQQRRAQRGGHEPPELADLRPGFGRDRHLGIRDRLQQQLAHLTLVAAVAIGVDERDRDVADPQLGDLGGHARGLLAIERDDRRAVGAELLGDGEATAAANQWRWLDLVGVVQVPAALAADLEHIAKAPGRDQRRLGIAALEQRVGGDRGPVDHGADRGRIDAGAGDRVHHPDRRILGRGQHLGLADLLGGIGPRVPREQVGEGAADIDAHVDHLVVFAPLRVATPARLRLVGECCMYSPAAVAYTTHPQYELERTPSTSV